MTENPVEILIKEIRAMREDVTNLRVDFAQNNKDLVQAVIGQNRVPTSALEKIVESNWRERKFWMSTVAILMTALISLARYGG